MARPTRDTCTFCTGIEALCRLRGQVEPAEINDNKTNVILIRCQWPFRGYQAATLCISSLKCSQIAKNEKRAT
ncbi:MAG TPA: hypothetical protein ENJ82_13300 [Bacteroidetes bacterium]|nr:hypothetical protein [Bacteroidota bacterium]